MQIVGNDSDFICIPSKTDGPSLWLSRLAKKYMKAHYLPEKFVPAAINGEYVDFSSLSVGRPNQSDEGMLRTLSALSRAS